MSPKPIATLFATVALAVLALPAAAGAGYYVPPGNSAVNQYTESFPGAGGESGGKNRDVTPGQALGAGNAKRLEDEGETGREAAEVAAETAPPADLYVSPEPSEARTGSEGEHGGRSNEGQGGQGGGANGGGGSSGGDSSGGRTSVEQPSGSSGLGSVLGQATGAEDGKIGLWLPLAIVLILAGSIAYRVRLRDHGRTA